MNDDRKATDYLNLLSQEFDPYLREMNVAARTTDKTLSEWSINKTIFLFAMNSLRQLLSFRSFFSLLGISSLYAYLHVEQVPLPLQVVYAILLLIPLYMFLRNATLAEMAKVGSPHFHLGAYEKLKAKEYKLLHPFFKDGHFKFANLKEDFKKVKVGEEPQKAEDETSRNKRYLQTIRELKKSEKQLEEQLYKLIQTLKENEDELTLLRERNDYLDRFLRQLRSKLTLLIKGEFTINMLDFGCSYSLYRVDGDRLMLRSCYGVNEQTIPSEISVHNDARNEVKAFKEEIGRIIYTEGEMISRKIRLSNYEHWIINLHLDDKSGKTLNPLTDLGKINLETTFDLLGVGLELVAKFGEKEGAEAS